MTRTARRILAALALATAVVAPAVVAPAPASAQSTAPIQYYVGKKLTASKDHSLGRVSVKKGTVAKVVKAHKSGGKTVRVDLEIGGKTHANIGVATVGANYQ